MGIQAVVQDRKLSQNELFNFSVEVNKISQNLYFVSFRRH